MQGGMPGLHQGHWGAELGSQQWQWPPPAAQHAEWQAAANGSTYRAFVFGAEVDEVTQQYYNVSGLGVNEVTAQQYSQVGMTFLGWQPVAADMGQPGSSDADSVRQFNSFAQQMQQLGATVVGLLRNQQVLFAALQQDMAGVKASVDHLGYGVGHVLQQQQQQTMMLQQHSQQMQLMIELQQKQLHGSSTVLASQVVIQRSMHGMQQQMGEVHMGMADVAGKQAQLIADTGRQAAAAARQRARPNLGTHSRVVSTKQGATTDGAAAAAAAAVNAAEAEAGVKPLQTQHLHWPGDAKTMAGERGSVVVTVLLVHLSIHATLGVRRAPANFSKYSAAILHVVSRYCLCRQSPLRRVSNVTAC
jgi:hypothetical protein